MKRLIRFYVDIFREINRNKKKIWALAKNDLKSRYAGSYLGVFWSYFLPLVTTLIYWFVFEKGFKAVPPSTLQVPFIVWFMAGLVPWFYFSEAWSSSTNVLLDYSYLVKQMLFEVRILPFVRTIAAMFVHVAFLVITGILLVAYNATSNIHILPFMYYFLCLFCLTISLSILTSVILPFFRDLAQIITVITTLGFWLTPIAWNYTDMDIPGLVLSIFKINPMFYVVQGYRDALLSPNFVWQSALMNIYFWAFVLVVFTLGAISYRKLRPHLSDVI